MQEHLNKISAVNLCPEQLVQIAAQFDVVIKTQRRGHGMQRPVDPVVVCVFNPDGGLRHEEHVKSNHTEADGKGGFPAGFDKFRDFLGHNGFPLSVPQIFVDFFLSNARRSGKLSHFRLLVKFF
jgi:hypothetical protein